MCAMNEDKLQVLLGQMREVVRQIACLFPTAIISGRGRQKVQRFVQLNELYYAGSHGMDIIGPQVLNLCMLTLCCLVARKLCNFIGAPRNVCGANA
jgi:Trehalose-phosphatase